MRGSEILGGTPSQFQSFSALFPECRLFLNCAKFSERGRGIAQRETRKAATFRDRLLATCASSSARKFRLLGLER
jgi:hypothetical protein